MRCECRERWLVAHRVRVVVAAVTRGRKIRHEIKAFGGSASVPDIGTAQNGLAVVVVPLALVGIAQYGVCGLHQLEHLGCLVEPVHVLVCAHVSAG
jgi:hypothetical protein